MHFAIIRADLWRFVQGWLAVAAGRSITLHDVNRDVGGFQDSDYFVHGIHFSNAGFDKMAASWEAAVSAVLPPSNLAAARAASTSSAPAREVFAFCAPCTAELFAGHWGAVTTVGVFGDAPPDLVAAAHQNGVKVVLGVQYGGDLANSTARAAWVAAQV